MRKKKFVRNDNNLAIAYYRYSSSAQNEASIEQQREAMRDVELHVEELTQAYRRADETFSVAQREYDVAAADLTDAEVSVIMAEIDSHNN